MRISHHVAATLFFAAAAIQPTAAVRPIEIPEVAVCLAGAARSLATVPVLRGLKRLVLQNPLYSASAFAALSYDTTSPQLLEYNATFTRWLSSPEVVKRALTHLKPELQSVIFFNTSTAISRFRSCRPSDTSLPSTDIPAMYGMQLVFSLVRRFEVKRGDEKFDFLLRVRPDHLFLQPLPQALGLNVSKWKKDRLLTFGYEADSFALMPSGPLAAVYFRSYTAASSCLFRIFDGDEKLPPSFAPSLQCAKLEPWENLARCVVASNLAYHGLPKLENAPRRPALIARVCNLNRTTNEPSWPAWPMPIGETCVTTLDALKRPRVVASYRAGSSSGGGGWMKLAVLLVFGATLFAAYTFRERLYEDFMSVYGILVILLGPYLIPAWEKAKPYVQPYYESAKETAMPYLLQAKEKLTPYYEQAMVAADPYLQQLKAYAAQAYEKGNELYTQARAAISGKTTKEPEYTIAEVAEPEDHDDDDDVLTK